MKIFFNWYIKKLLKSRNGWLLGIFHTWHHVGGRKAKGELQHILNYFVVLVKVYCFFFLKSQEGSQTSLFSDRSHMWVIPYIIAYCIIFPFSMFSQIQSSKMLFVLPRQKSGQSITLLASHENEQLEHWSALNFPNSLNV